jgi:hypothetical protein
MGHCVTTYRKNMGPEGLGRKTSENRPNESKAQDENNICW